MISENGIDTLTYSSLKKEFIIDINSCSGCRLCELICSLRKRSSCNPKKAYIKVIKNIKYKIYIPIFTSSCDFCGGEPACLSVCPTKSISFISEHVAALEINEKAGKLPMIIIKGD